MSGSAGGGGAGDPAAEGEVVFRELVTADQLAALPPFEHRIWGSGGDAVSVNMLVAVVSEGGVAIGAFCEDEIVGAVFGFRTHEPHVLHSHYMAVDPAWRRRGLGVQLKQRQRQWCLERGITGMRWTYDPLQLGNAHLNLRGLGAVGVSYHRDHYGTLGGINGRLPSDRITVWWDLTGTQPRTAATDARQPDHDAHGADVEHVDVPPASADDIAASNDAAMHARLHVRGALEPRMAAGWRLVDVDRALRRYTLAPPA